MGLEAWEKAKMAELALVKALAGVWGNPGAGYQERWPETWEADLKRKLNQKRISVTGLMDHVVRVSTETYAGTVNADDFALFHDGL